MHNISCRKIPKINPGAYIIQRPFLRGLFSEGLIYEGNLRFKIDWAGRIVGSKFTIFALFYFVFGDNFPSTSPRGAYIWRGLYMEGLIFGFYCMLFVRLFINKGFSSQDVPVVLQCLEEMLKKRRKQVGKLHSLEI